MFKFGTSNRALKPTTSKGSVKGDKRLMDGQMGARRESPFLWRREDFRRPQTDDMLHWLETWNTFIHSLLHSATSERDLGWRTRRVHKFRCQVSGDNAGPDPIFDLDCVQPVILLLQREREWKTEQSVKDEAGSGYSIGRPASVVALHCRQGDVTLGKSDIVLLSVNFFCPFLLLLISRRCKALRSLFGCCQGRQILTDWLIDVKNRAIKCSTSYEDDRS